VNFEQIKEKYLLCMIDISERSSVCRDLIDSGSSPMPEALKSEFLALLLRRILEQIAIASFVANKSAYEKALNKTQGAHINLRSVTHQLKALNPNYFPTPYRLEQAKEDGVQHHAAKLPNELIPLSEKELLSAHKRCGSSLHSRNPFHSKLNYKTEISYFDEILTKISVLLQEHLISPIGTNELLYFIMSSPNQTDPQIIHLAPHMTRA